LIFRVDYRFALVAYSLAVASLAGCEANNPLGRQAIDGTVTLNGEAVEKGSIEFSPHGAGKGVSSGARIVDGQYSIAAEKGLPPGSYLVQIYAPKLPKAVTDKISEGKPPGMDAPERDFLGVETIPPEYNLRSDKIVEVSAEGLNQFDYTIKTR